VSERSIIFSGPMVRAILAGSKTQTRRIVKRTDTGRVKEPGAHRNWHVDDPEAVMACPYGVPGDRLWVRETCALWASMPDGRLTIPDGAIPYKATDPEWDAILRDMEVIRNASCGRAVEHGNWSLVSPIHMPRWASRITLELTDVRVQRLQEISEADARAEASGSLVDPKVGALWSFQHGDARAIGKSARNCFPSAWDWINGKRAPWDSNPWVWALTFRQVQP
jgi:hypothetical protein